MSGLTHARVRRVLGDLVVGLSHGEMREESCVSDRIGSSGEDGRREGNEGGATLVTRVGKIVALTTQHGSEGRVVGTFGL